MYKLDKQKTEANLQNVSCNSVMTKTLEITFRNHWTSIKEGFLILAFIPIGLVIGHLSGKLTKDDYPDALIILGLFYLLFFLPAIYFHISYYLNNRGLKITLGAKTFCLTKDGQTKEYSYSDIRTTQPTSIDNAENDI